MPPLPPRVGSLVAGGLPFALPLVLIVLAMFLVTGKVDSFGQSIGF